MAPGGRGSEGGFSFAGQGLDKFGDDILLVVMRDSRRYAGGELSSIHAVEKGKERINEQTKAQNEEQGQASPVALQAAARCQKPAGARYVAILFGFVSNAM